MQGGPEYAVQTLGVDTGLCINHLLYGRRGRGEAPTQNIRDRRKYKVFIESLHNNCNGTIVIFTVTLQNCFNL